MVYTDLECVYDKKKYWLIFNGTQESSLISVSQDHCIWLIWINKI